MSYLDKLLDGVEVEWKTVGDTCEIKTGKGITKNVSSDSAPYPIISGGKEPMGYFEKFNRIENTVTISRVGANAGYVNYIESKFYLNDKCFSILPIEKYKTKIDSKFLFYILKAKEANITELQSDGGVPTINTNKVGSIQIPIPPLAVQKEIVRILDSFTELTTELTAELTARKKQHLFYREQFFEFNNLETKREPLGLIGEFQRGKRFVKDDMIAEGVPCIHYGEMYTHYGSWADRSKSFLSEELVERKNLRIAENSDVVIVAAGETIEDIGMGTAWLGYEGVVIHDACFSFRSPLNPKYVAYFTRTKQFHDQIKKHISSGKISAINARGLEKVLIPVPSLSEQERIVSILDKFDILTTSIS
ncbi:MAG: restriction endonuclease subunit S, partial [Bacteroidetes bacterium]|nr:restriction endonuclease subunit S [Bacteroidota bacterium]